jgi:hypothetical protein
MEENQGVGVARWGGGMDGKGDWVFVIEVIDGWLKGD